MLDKGSKEAGAQGIKPRKNVALIDSLGSSLLGGAIQFFLGHQLAVPLRDVYLMHGMMHFNLGVSHILFKNSMVIKILFGLLSIKCFIRNTHKSTTALWCLLPSPHLTHCLNWKNKTFIPGLKTLVPGGPRSFVWSLHWDLSRNRFKTAKKIIFGFWNIWN